METYLQDGVNWNKICKCTTAVDLVYIVYTIGSIIWICRNSCVHIYECVYINVDKTYNKITSVSLSPSILPYHIYRAEHFMLELLFCGLPFSIVQALCCFEAMIALFLCHELPGLHNVSLRVTFSSSRLCRCYFAMVTHKLRMFPRLVSIRILQQSWTTWAKINRPYIMPINSFVWFLYNEIHPGTEMELNHEYNQR